MGLLFLAGCASGAAGAALARQPRELPTRSALERTARVGLSGSTPVVITGDWAIGATVTTGTDSRLDTVNNRELAWRREDDETQARIRGEEHHDPVTQMVLRKPPVYAPSAGDQVMRSLRAGQAAALPLSVWDPICGRHLTLRTPR